MDTLLRQQGQVQDEIDELLAQLKANNVSLQRDLTEFCSIYETSLLERTRIATSFAEDSSKNTTQELDDENATTDNILPE